MLPPLRRRTGLPHAFKRCQMVDGTTGEKKARYFNVNTCTNAACTYYKTTEIVFERNEDLDLIEYRPFEKDFDCDKIGI